MSFLRKNLYSSLKLVKNYALNQYYPFVVVLRLNDACNMSCEYCESYKFSSSIDYNSLIPFLEKVYKAGCRFLILTGGEPYLYKDRNKLLQWIKNKNIYLVLNTNGKLIADKEYQDFLMEADEVLVSLDGPKEIQDNHRGKGSFDRTIALLDILKKNKIKITISAVITPINIEQYVFDFFKAIKSTYSAYIGFSPVSYSGKINDNTYTRENELNNDNINKLVFLIKKNKNIFKEIPNVLLNYFLKPKPFICKTAQYALYVDSNEMIYPCINVTDRTDAIIGNIKSFTGVPERSVKCKICYCSALVVANLALEKRPPTLKFLVEISKRYIRF